MLNRKHAACQRDYRIQSFLSIRHVHGDLCKHLGIDSSTNPYGMSVFSSPEPKAHKASLYDGSQVGVCAYVSASVHTFKHQYLSD